MQNPLAIRDLLRYIPLFRGATFVIKLNGELITQTDQLANVIVDVALLQQLGIRPIMVHGAGHQMANLFELSKLRSENGPGGWIITGEQMELIKQTCSLATLELTRLFSNIAQTVAPIRLFTGNTVRAKRRGVISGIDHCLSGEVDQVDTATISAVQSEGLLPIISPLASDKNGSLLFLGADELATQVAISLKAQKLIFLVNADGVFVQRKLISQLTVEEAKELSKEGGFVSGSMLRKLRQGTDACQKGVDRVHFINGKRDGVLLQELFSRDGIGTMIHRDVYANIRPAEPKDVQPIMELTDQEASEGRLVHHGIEEVQRELGSYFVYEKDSQVIGCCRLVCWPESQMAEIRHLVVDDSYRRQGVAANLVERLEQEARQRGMRQIFALTTRAESWFVNRNFEVGSPDLLPPERRGAYDHTRNSKVMVKSL